MTDNGNKGYDDLFVDEQEPQEIILNAVEPYLRFTEEGKIVEQDEFYNLNGKQQILVLILGTKVLEAKNIRQEEGMRVAELKDITGMKESSIEGYVYGHLSNIVNSDEGRIFVPKYRVAQAAEELGVTTDGS